MGKFLKVTGIVAGLIVLLIVAAIIIVPLVVDPNDYREKIVDIVEKQTGRQIRILGDIQLSVFPWLGVKAGVVEIGNAPGFDETVFARWEDLRIRLRILPLFSRRVEMGVITVNGMTVNLSRRADGVTNWDDLSGKGEEKASKEEKDGSAGTAISALAIGGVNIENATIRWRDRMAGRSTVIKNMALKTSAITVSNPVKLTFSADFDDENLGLTGALSATCRVTANLIDERYQVKDFSLAADLRGKSLPGERARIVVDGDFSVDGKRKTFDLGLLKISVNELSFPPYTGEAALEIAGRGDLESQIYDLTTVNVTTLLSGEAEQIRGEIVGKSRADMKAGKITVSEMALKIPGLKTKAMGADLTGTLGAEYDLKGNTVRVAPFDLKGTISGVMDSGKPIPVALAAGMHADIGKKTASVDSFRLSAMDLHAVGSLSVEQLLTDPKARGTLSVERFNPGALLAGLMKTPPKTADKGAFSSAELKADFSVSADALRIDRMTAVLDDTRMSGTVMIRQKPSTDFSFSFKADRLDLDRYLPPGESSQKAAAAGAAGAPVAAAAGAAGLPVDTLRELALDGKVRLDRLTAFGTVFSNIDIGFKAGGGILTLSPADGEVYGGRLATTASLDVRGDQPVIDVTEKIRNLRVDRLLTDMKVDTGSVNLSGPSDIDLSVVLSTDGNTETFTFRKLFLDGNLGGRLPVGLDAKGVIQPNANRIEFDGFRLSLGGMKANGSVQLAGKGDQMGFETRFSVEPFNLRQLARQLGMAPLKTSDANAYSSVAMRASASGTAGSARVKDLIVRLDDTTMKGSVDIAAIAPPSYRFDLTVDRLDADRYLPPPEKGKKQAAATPGAALAAIPVEPLRALTLDGKLAVGSLKIANLKLAEIQLQAAAKDGLLSVHPLSANLYGGKYSGNISLDAKGKQPVLNLDEKLEHVQVGGLLRDMQGKAFVTGSTEAGMKLTATGADADAIVKSLSGDVAFTLTDGTIQGVDILGKVCRTLAAFSAGTLKKEDLIGSAVQILANKAAGTPKTEEAGSTAFSELKGTMTFSNGIGTNRNLTIQSPLLRVEGEGTLNLPNQSLDYQATVALVKSCEGQGGKRFSELANFPIPVRISGPLAKPEVKPDLTSGLAKLLRSDNKQPQAEPASAPTAPEPPASGSSGPLSDTLSEPPQKQQAAPPPSQDRKQPQPADPKKQTEEALKGILQKGLQDLLKK